MRRLAFWSSLSALLLSAMPACAQQDSLDSVMADCGGRIPPRLVDSCLERVRVLDETNPSPQLQALEAQLSSRAERDRRDVGGGQQGYGQNGPPAGYGGDSNQGPPPAGYGPGDQAPPAGYGSDDQGPPPGSDQDQGASPYEQPPPGDQSAPDEQGAPDDSTGQDDQPPPDMSTGPGDDGGPPDMSNGPSSDGPPADDTPPPDDTSPHP